MRIETSASIAPARGSSSPPHGGADRNGPGVGALRLAGGRPLTGVRIETGAGSGWRVRGAVAPSRGCGSKPGWHWLDAVQAGSPPHGGADRNFVPTIPMICTYSRPLTGVRIETSSAAVSRGCCSVAPSRGCGSKQGYQGGAAVGQQSPPHGGADRNTNEGEAYQLPARRPLTGVRIETRQATPKDPMRLSPPHGGADRNMGVGSEVFVPVVAPSRGCGSKRSQGRKLDRASRSPPHGGADRNLYGRHYIRRFVGSPPHGGADRNFAIRVVAAWQQGRPLTGVRIETARPGEVGAQRRVAPSRGCGSKHL